MRRKHDLIPLVYHGEGGPFLQAAWAIRERPTEEQLRTFADMLATATWAEGFEAAELLKVFYRSPHHRLARLLEWRERNYEGKPW